jgi:hypothetical protein
LSRHLSPDLYQILAGLVRLYNDRETLSSSYLRSALHVLTLLPVRIAKRVRIRILLRDLNP